MIEIASTMIILFIGIKFINFFMRLNADIQMERKRQASIQMFNELLSGKRKLQ